MHICVHVLGKVINRSFEYFLITLTITKNCQQCPIQNQFNRHLMSKNNYLLSSDGEDGIVICLPAGCEL